MKNYEDVCLKIQKRWKSFFESLTIVIFGLILVYYLFITKNNGNISELKKFGIFILLYFIMYVVGFIKLYAQKSKLKKENFDFDSDEIDEKFSISNYELYQNLKYEFKKSLKNFLTILIISSIILCLIYFNITKDKKEFDKKYNSDKWYTEWAILDHYDSPEYEDQEYSKGYFYYIGKDGKKYEYIGKIGSIDRETFRKTKEYKQQIYVSETDNSKSMKYEVFSNEYELVNIFVVPLVLGFIIMNLIKILMIIVRLIFTQKYIK